MSVMDEKIGRGKDSEVKQISQDFFENCGLHGINKMKPNKKNPFRRYVSEMIFIFYSLNLSQNEIYFMYF